MARAPQPGNAAEPGRRRPHRDPHTPPPSYHDWIGQATLQENIAGGPQLETLAGLDATRWLVVGMSIIPASGSSAVDDICVDAVDLHAMGITAHTNGFHGVKAFAEQYGALPVTRIHLQATSLRDLLTHMTGGRLRLQKTGLTNTHLEVVSQSAHQTGAPHPPEPQKRLTSPPPREDIA